jgi:hypothetical protein
LTHCQSQFLLHNVTHDWNDADCIKILRHLRDAAQPTTQLIICGDIVLHVCDEPGIEDIPGAIYPSPPAPLQRNLGMVNIQPYLTDLEVCTVLLSG